VDNAIHEACFNKNQVEIRWNDRQFILPGLVANKIGIGATRNLIVRNRSQKHTEEAIRNDLEHIHNLIVIRIIFNGPDALIETNSVHNALYARTCMLSRAVYKGSKIDWDDDECATPYPEQPHFQQEKPSNRKKINNSLMNRFQLLDMDGNEDDTESGEHEIDGLIYTAMTSQAAGLIT